MSFIHIDKARLQFEGLPPMRRSLAALLVLLAVAPFALTLLVTVLQVTYPFPTNDDSASWRNFFRPITDMAVLGLLLMLTVQVGRGIAVLRQLLNNQSVIIDIQLTVVSAHNTMDATLEDVQRRIAMLEEWARAQKMIDAADHATGHRPDPGPTT